MFRVILEIIVTTIITLSMGISLLGTIHFLPQPEIAQSYGIIFFISTICLFIFISIEERI